MRLSPFTKRLVSIVVVLNLFVAAVGGAWLRHSLEQNRRDARAVVDNLAQVLQASLIGTIRQIDLALLTVADEYKRQSAAGPIDAKVLDQLFARQQAHLPGIESLRGMDERGCVCYGPGADPRTNLSDREFFIASRDRADAGLVIAKPVFARIARKWVMVFARRLETADGRFAGVAYVNVALDHLSREFTALNIGPSGSASLRDADLGVIVRVPTEEGGAPLVGNRAVSPALRDLVSAGKSGGNYIARTGFDQVERASAFRRLEPYPLYVVIGMAENDYLAVWRQEVVAATLVFVLFALATLTSAWLLVRAWRSQEATAQELARSRVELEQHVVERTAQLAAANRELEEFSYSMSHDMRTPLRAINGYSTILLEDHRDGLDAEGQRLLRALGHNAERMGRLIDDILRFLGMARRKVRPTQVDVRVLASEIIAELQAKTPQLELRLAAGEAPPAWADYEMLKLLLAELIDNAVKFAAPGRQPLIEISGERADGENVYHVRDNGVGFDMRFADKLFKVFERLHAGGDSEGSGIGLAIVKRIVDRHGGRVWAEGAVGTGAAFHFSLPRPPA